MPRTKKTETLMPTTAEQLLIEQAAGREGESETRRDRSERISLAVRPCTRTLPTTGIVAVPSSATVKLPETSVRPATSTRITSPAPTR